MSCVVHMFLNSPADRNTAVGNVSVIDIKIEGSYLLNLIFLISLIQTLSG